MICPETAKILGASGWRARREEVDVLPAFNCCHLVQSLGHVFQERFDFFRWQCHKVLRTQRGVAQHTDKRAWSNSRPRLGPHDPLADRANGAERLSFRGDAKMPTQAGL
jgi:hypothetical protein